MADDLHDLSFRTAGSTAEIRHMDHYLVAGHRSHILALGDEHIPSDLLGIRQDKAEIFIFLIKPYDLLVRMLHHLDDPALCPPSGRLVLDHQLYLVPMEGISCFLRRDEHILLHPLHRHKAEALGMAGKEAGDRKDLRLSVPSLFRDAHRSFCHEHVQHLFKLAALFLWDI